MFSNMITSFNEKVVILKDKLILKYDNTLKGLDGKGGCLGIVVSWKGQRTRFFVS